MHTRICKCLSTIFISQVIVKEAHSPILFFLYALRCSHKNVENDTFIGKSQRFEQL